MAYPPTVPRGTLETIAMLFAKAVASTGRGSRDAKNALHWHSLVR